MDDLISRQALYEKTAEWEAQALYMVEILINDEDKTEWRRWTAILNERTAFKHDVADAPSAEPQRKKGKWTEKEVIHADEAKEIITEWQSCKCSVCGRYHTQPYMYFFAEPRFCSWCGAEMVKGETDG